MAEGYTDQNKLHWYFTPVKNVDGIHSCLVHWNSKTHRYHKGENQGMILKNIVFSMLNIIKPQFKNVVLDKVWCSTEKV